MPPGPLTRAVTFSEQGANLWGRGLRYLLDTTRPAINPYNGSFFSHRRELANDEYSVCQVTLEALQFIPPWHSFSGADIYRVRVVNSCPRIRFNVIDR